MRLIRWPVSSLTSFTIAGDVCFLIMDVSFKPPLATDQSKFIFVVNNSTNGDRAFFRPILTNVLFNLFMYELISLTRVNDQYFVCFDKYNFFIRHVMTP
ncbi:hypothetical protein AK51_29375 [Serratia nematodiphila DZ0503SBS1]|nr:hypothetical protein AK51_29375 [Serratia nematodiphila DZ0503SBS1]